MLYILIFLLWIEFADKTRKIRENNKKRMGVLWKKLAYKVLNIK